MNKEKQIEEKKYVCVQKCPELDYTNSHHCKCTNPNTVFEEYPGCCPVGNIPKWVLESEDTQ